MRRRLVPVIVLMVAALAGSCGSRTPTGARSLERLPVPGSSTGATAAMAADAAPAIAQRGRVEYRVQGTLPSLPATAPAYRLGTTIATGRIPTLARAFGVAGEVRTGTAASVVGDATRQLRVDRSPGLPWSVGPSCGAVSIDGSAGRTASGGVGSGSAGNSGGGASSSGANASSGEATPPAPASDAPAGAPATTASTTGGGTTPPPTKPPAPTSPAPSTGPTVPPEDTPGGCAIASTGVVSSPGGTVTVPLRPADLPTKDEAQRIALDALRRAGLAVDGAVTVEDLQTSWMVRVDPVVDHLPTIGRTTSVTVGPKGSITQASGFLDDPAKLGDYPLAGVDTGLDRLRNGTRIGPQPMMGVAEPATATATAGSSGGAPGVAPTPPGSTSGATATSTTAEPVTVVPVTGVHLALETADGRLVPVYVFELGVPAGGQPGWSPSSIAVPAVVDRLLEEPTSTTTGGKVRGAPVPQPATRPSP